MSTEIDKELDLLLNSEKKVKIGNKEVIVHKISMLDSIKLAGHLSVMASAMVNNSDATARAVTMLSYVNENTEDVGSINSVRMMGLAQLLAIVGTDGAEIISDVVEKCTNITYEEIDEISAEDGIDLLVDIFEVNKSFFTKLSKKLGKKMNKAKEKKEVKKTKKA